VQRVTKEIEMIHLTTMQTPTGEILGYTVEAVNCLDPETELQSLIYEGCTIKGNKVHFFKMWTYHEGCNHEHEATRKARILAELLCVGLVRKTEIVTVQEFKG